MDYGISTICERSIVNGKDVLAFHIDIRDQNIVAYITRRCLTDCLLMPNNIHWEAFYSDNNEQFLSLTKRTIEFLRSVVIVGYKNDKWLPSNFKIMFDTNSSNQILVSTFNDEVWSPYLIITK